MNEDMKGYDHLFVGGDLSGIQKFLYNITSHKALVSLIGRSHFLSDYMNKVCDDVVSLPAFKGHSARVIYCSGGKFYVVADNVDGAIDELGELTRTVKKKLWQEHRGELSINFGVVPFSENPDGSINAGGKVNSKCGVLWELVTKQFAQQKNQKFKDEILASFEDFFETQKISSKPKVCAVTGIESDDCVMYEDYMMLPSVKEQIIKGAELERTRGFKTFEDYAKDSYLGILRMDVDGLGTRFIKGFDSIAEYQKFSQHLTDFFENGKLQEIQQKNEYRDYLNIVYAGGDDIFAVGRWDKLIDFAAEVSLAFEKHTAGEGVTISGGIAIVHDKFPIAKAAEMAGDAEHTAKKYNNEAKNAFCMFGEPLSWENEFAYVRQFKDDFVRLINNDGMSRGILHRLMNYYVIVRLNKERKKKGRKPDYSYMWHLPYYLTRYISRIDDKSEVAGFCRQLRDKELTRGEEQYRLIAIAARWAELLIRNNK